jgi:hypothetical protein
MQNYIKNFSDCIVELKLTIISKINQHGIDILSIFVIWNAEKTAELAVSPSQFLHLSLECLKANQQG